MAQNIYNRAQIVDDNFVAFCRDWTTSPNRRIGLDEPVREGAPICGRELIELFESQILTRQLDLISRVLRARDAAFYTIGSAGHEGNVVLGRLTRPTDPFFPHYRSGAFVVERTRYRPEIDPAYDIVLSQVASAEDPISGGRHKVWGSAPLWILPQTSTIASHLPKAVGTAIAIRRALKLGVEPPIPRDSIVICSFGDASVNHSTAVGAINAALRAAYEQLPVPILFVCEDNGIGISVRTPDGWVANAYSSRPGLRYFAADGLDLVEAHRSAREAVDWCRKHARPAFLHLRTVRLMGHAGTDVELEYRSVEDVAAMERLDPLQTSARIVFEAGLLSPDEVLDRYESARRRVAQAAERATTRRRLSSATEIIAPLAPFHPDRVAAAASGCAPTERRLEHWGSSSTLPENLPPRHMAALINMGLQDLFLLYREAVLFGEDVAQKGGVYHVTTGLQKKFGASRIFNTILDEQTILGMAQGFAYLGLLPFPEIQYLAYFHNACDQIRGEACSTQFFSNDQYRNPMVLRIASLAYQKGFGGHFHNDNSIAALRDIPGLVIACPSRGDDAVSMLRTAAALARTDGRVVAYLEPIALYMTKDLYETKDGGWQFAYPTPGEFVPLGQSRIYDEEARDLAILTFGNGVPMSLRAARQIERETGARARVLDLRWLAPLDREAIARHASACGRALVVDEGRESGGVGEAIITAIVEGAGSAIPTRRVVGRDTYIPLGPAANLVLPDEAAIVAAALELVGAKPSR